MFLIMIIVLFVLFLKGIKFTEKKYTFFLIIFLIGFNLIVAVPMSWEIGVLSIFGIFIICFISALILRKKYVSNKKVVSFAFVICLVLSVYVQFFNGIEMFQSPSTFFAFQKQIIFRYVVPPKIYGGNDGIYLYSLFVTKNTNFMFPNSITKIELYNGRVAYWFDSSSFGDTPRNFRHYLDTDETIDTGA